MNDFYLDGNHVRERRSMAYIAVFQEGATPAYKAQVVAAPRLLYALQAAREFINCDRVNTADCHMRPDNTLDEDGAAAVAEYDAVLQTIDEAIAKAMVS